MRAFGFVLAAAAGFAELVAGQSNVNSGIGNYQYIGCYYDPGNPRALEFQIGTVGGTDVTTVEACYTACNGQYTYFGLEYFSQCWCANEVDQFSGPATETDCNTPCSGNNAEWCGGGNRLSMYSVNGVEPPWVNPPPDEGGGDAGAGGNDSTLSTVVVPNSAEVSRSERSASVSSSKAAWASSRSARSYSVSVSKQDYYNSKASANSVKSAERDASRTSRLQHNASQSSARSAAYASKSSASDYRASLRSAASESKSSASLSRANARSLASVSRYGPKTTSSSTAEESSSSSSAAEEPPPRMQQRDVEEQSGTEELEVTELEAAMALITEAPVPRDLEGLGF